MSAAFISDIKRGSYSYSAFYIQYYFIFPIGEAPDLY